MCNGVPFLIVCAVVVPVPLIFDDEAAVGIVRAVITEFDGFAYRLRIRVRSGMRDRSGVLEGDHFEGMNPVSGEVQPLRRGFILGILH